MSTPKVLIVGSVYCDTPLRKTESELWGRIVEQQNKDCDLFLLDSKSPFEPLAMMPTPSRWKYWSFDDNIGCITRGGRDGSGRAFCEALKIAAREGYDYVVVWETDVLFVPSVRPIINKMRAAGVKLAAMFANPFQFVEFGIAFWDVKYAVESKFVERYNWEKTPPWPIPEFRIQNLTENELFILPMHGWRNSENTMNVANIVNIFPYKLPVFLTHCRDANVYIRWLDLHGMRLT